jgi:hypothetical protein
MMLLCLPKYCGGHRIKTTKLFNHSVLEICRLLGQVPAAVCCINELFPFSHALGDDLRVSRRGGILQWRHPAEHATDDRHEAG